MEVEVAEDRLWRSSSSKFNTGGPVLKELLLAWRPKSRRERVGGWGGGSQSVGIRREAASEGLGGEGRGGGEGCCSTALCSRQALSGHTITQVGRASNRKKK